MKIIDITVSLKVLCTTSLKIWEFQRCLSGSDRWCS